MCVTVDELTAEPLTDWQWLYSYQQAITAAQVFYSQEPLPKFLTHGLDPVSVILITFYIFVLFVDYFEILFWSICFCRPVFVINYNYY